MKKIAALILFLLSAASTFAVTRPDWAQIANKPEIYVRDYGAVGDGTTDDTAAIAAAIASATARGGGTVRFGLGTYLTDSITVPSYVTLAGARDESGWARISTYTMGTTLRLNAPSTTSLLIANGGTILAGVRDMTLDGNRANQTASSVHCIRTRTGAARTFGFTIQNVRCVYPSGWGIFASGGPLNISNSFFMSGGVFSSCSDTKVSDCDFDGTSGYHPSLILANTSTSGFTNCFAYGWGETVATEQVQSYYANVDTSSVMNATESFWIYEDCPVLVSGLTASGTSSVATYFAHNTTGNSWEFYSKPYSATAATPTKLLFTASGTARVRHGGGNEVARLSASTYTTFSSCRFAGGIGYGLVVVDSFNNLFVGNRFWNNNKSATAGVSSLYLYDSYSNSFAANLLGEVPAGTINYAIVLEESTANTCSKNVFDPSNQYFTASGGVILRDLTVPTYKNRNRFHGITGALDSGVARVYSPWSLMLEPGIQVGQFNLATCTPVEGVATSVPLTSVLRRGVNFHNSATYTVDLRLTEYGLYQVSGVVGVTGYGTANSCRVLVNIAGLGAYSDSSTLITAQSFTVSAEQGTLSIPFNHTFYSSASADISLQLQITQVGVASNALQVYTDPRYSRLIIRKLADVPYQ